MHNDELQLTRHRRTTLSRLRCGHHLGLSTYQQRLDQNYSPQCTSCNQANETVAHVLLDCASHADDWDGWGVSNMRVMWIRPIAMMAFLGEEGRPKGFVAFN